jgi:predicted RND superfamily exporter protein
VKRVARVSLTSTLEGLASIISKQPKLTLAVLAIVTVALGFGIPRITLTTDILDWLPATDTRVQALNRIIREVDGVTNQELVWLELNPVKAEAIGVTRITDELAIRAQDELASFVQTRVPEVRFTFGLPHWLKVANATLNPEQKVASLPENSAQFRLLWNGIWQAQRELLSATIGADEQGTLLGFVIEGDPVSADSRRIGTDIQAAVQAYLADNSKQYDLFQEDNLFPVGLASGLAGLDASLARDLRWLVPVGIIIVAALLWLAFGHWQTVIIALSCLLTAGIWLFGLMGYLGLPLNVVNAALLPLLLGSGIDYAIHLLNALQASRQRHISLDKALQTANAQAGGGMVLVTLTSLLGLASLLLAGVPGISQLGVLASVSLLCLLIVVITLPTALYSLQKDISKAQFKPSRWLKKVLTTLEHRPFLTLSILILGTALALLARQDPQVQLDVIQGNFPARAPTRRALEQMRAGVAGALPEFIVLEGDLTSPEVLAYTQAVADNLNQTLDARLITPSLMLGSYSSLQTGLTGALGQFFGTSLDDAVPDSQVDLASTYKTMHNDPLWAPLIKLVSNPTANLGLMIVMPTSSGDLAATRETLTTMQQAVDISMRPANLEVHVIGYRSISVLFIETSLRWLQRLFVASLIATCLVTLLAFRRWQIVLATAAIVSITGLVWFVLLPLVGVYISIFLLFPLIFLVSLGSDYALHLFWHAHRAEQMLSSSSININKDSTQRDVYGETGKAVFFSAMTDAAVFGVFSLAYLSSVTQVMLASTLAVIITFITTLLVIPLVPTKSQNVSLPNS